MAVVQMKRLNIVALTKDKNAILRRLQELGTLEIHMNVDKLKSKKKLKNLTQQDTSNERAMYDKYASISEQAIEILDKYVEEKASLLSSLAGQPLVARSEFIRIEDNQEKIAKRAGQIVSWEKQITEANAEIQKKETQLEALVPWMGLDIPLNTPGTKRTKLFLGLIPENLTQDQISQRILEDNKTITAVDVEVVFTEQDTVYVSVVCLNKDAQAVEEALRKMSFAAPAIWSKYTPEIKQQRLNRQIAEKKEEIDAAIAKIKEAAVDRQDIKMVSDYYRMRAQRYEVLGMLPQTDKTIAISGFAPAGIAESIAGEIEADYGAAVEVIEPKAKTKTPVLLKNNAVSESVEGIVASYGLPKKGEIDPTVVTSIFYIIFFGMMLSDAGYGLLMAIALGVILAKFKDMNPGMRKSLKMFFWGGISTIVWGLLFGGFFGDAIGVFSECFGNGQTTFDGFWFNPIGSPMQLLLWCLVFGLIHMFVGLGINGAMMLKRGDVVGFVSDVIAWYLFLIGLIVLLMSSSIYASMAGTVPFFKDIDLGTTGLYIGLVLAVVGGVIILFMSGRRKSNVGMRILLGVYDIYGITSWLSDWLSYSRLLALGLATGAIGQVINMICQMLFLHNYQYGAGGAKGAIIGGILFFVVFIVGHVANMAINLLSAYVHSNRLEFVEFFGKFYNGGAKEFEPYATETKYVRFAKSK
ncbi:V-type ATP synthase subunit I [Eubacterium oxidoreducens]|uniref:V/A-type H+-transporting ATPase subunit I n=1 Tax=Eubacterium oxidoreducens TaxID=1732 RepID=A0A1G6C7V4_EUBOX|nr:V-type ATP synthase subunit I [Eubacterium oxidoreducens]SDB28882.1 V/A-type H+-transporting ATPase subunit I [Eubacterium oxidoreducens]